MVTYKMYIYGSDNFIGAMHNFVIENKKIKFRLFEALSFIAGHRLLPIFTTYMVIMQVYSSKNILFFRLG